MDLTITGTPAGATALVVVRDGPSGAWVAAKETTPGTQWQATVKYAYTIAAVCHEQPEDAPEVWRTVEYAYSINDVVPDPMILCSAAPVPKRPIVGTMVQAGQVQIGGAVVSSDAPNWQISMLAEDSPHQDVIASSKDHVQIMRDVDVSTLDDTHPLPAIDVEANGVAMTPVQVTSDATASETVQARVAVQTPRSGPVIASIYAGPLANVMIAPQSMLDADDVELLTVEAVDGTQHRVLTKPLGDPAFALPAPIVEGSWLPAASDAAAKPAKPEAPIAVSWEGLPDGKKEAVEMDLVGSASDPASPTSTAAYRLVVSPGYLQDAVFNSIQLETDVPGFDAKWRLDPTKPYTRTFLAAAGSLERDYTALTESITPAAP